MPIYKVNGDTYDIPASKQEAFEKKYPDASVSYLNGSDEYEIPLSKRDAFVSKFPKATLKTYSVQQQDSFPMFDDEPNAPLNAYNKTTNQSQNQPEQDDNVETNFFKGLHQRNKNIWQAGLWHSLRGEIANLFTGSSREEQAALNDIEYLESVGIDPREYLAGVEDAEFQKLYGMNREQFDALDKSERRRLAKDAASRQGELSKDAIKALEKERKQRQSVIDAYQDALAEAGGDLDKAKEILRAKAEDKTWGDEQIEKANAIYAENKELQGAAKWGGLAASAIPSAAALGLSFLTKGKTAGISRWLNKAAKLAGNAGMAGMTAGTAGLSMIEARQHGATNWETWITGIADGLIEFITEKIPFDKLTKPVLTAAKTRTTKALMDAMRHVDSPGRKELEKLLTEANKKLGGKLLNGKNVADWLANAATEGVSEATAEALQTVTSMIYLNPEEYPTFAEVANAAWEGAKGGIALGGVLGGAGKAVEHSLHKDRRKQQGFVNVALVEQEGKNPFVAELVDYDPETKTYKALQDGEIVDVKEDEVQYKHQYTYNEFESGRYRQLEDEAIADGTVSDAQVAVSADRLGNARQKLEQVLTESGYTDEEKNQVYATLESGDIPDFHPQAKALWDAADEYTEALKRDREIQSAKEVKAENERRSVLDVMAQMLGGEFWQKGSKTMQENGMEIIEPDMVEVGTMQDGRQVFILSTPNDNGEVAAITEDGKKMFIRNTDLQDGTTIMPLQEYLDARVSEQKKTAEQARMAEEAAPQLGAIRQNYQMGTQVNLGTEESPTLGQVIGIKPENDGVFIQTEAGVVPYTYEQLADIAGTPIRVMTDAQIAAAEAAEIEAAESARMSELAETPEQMTDAETVGDNAVQMESVATETPLPTNPDGSVNEDALFRESPERWAVWNDEQSQDGGISSAQYIETKLAKAQARLAELQNMYSVEDSLNKKRTIQAEIVKQQGVVEDLAAVMQKHTPAETVQSTPVVAQQERTAESVLASLNDGTLTDEEIRANIDANLAEAQKAYDKYAKKAPKMGTDKDAYLAEKQKYEQGLPALQQEIDFWNGVKQTYESAMQQETMPAEESFRPELSEEDMNPQTPQELAARELGLQEGGIKLLWDSVKAHTGFGDGERQKFFGIFRSKDKGGMTIEAAGDRLMEIDREYDLGLLDQSDPMAGVNAILDVLGDVQTIGDLRNYIANNREMRVAREAAAAYSAMNAEFETTHGMTMEEWAHANEVQRIEIMSKSALTEAEEYERNVKFAEEEYQYGTNEQSTGTEGVSGGENQEDAGNVEGAADSLYRQGDSILQEAQPDNTGGETVSAGQTEENVSESDNQDGDTSVHAGEQTAEVDDLPPAYRGVDRSQDDAEHLADPLAMTIETRLKLMAETREAIHERVNTWSNKLGIKINIIDNYRDVQNKKAKAQIEKGVEVWGWFETSTGEVCIYLPDFMSLSTSAALSEIDKTCIHEIVSHKGLRGLLGEDAYGELCDMVWEAMTEEEQQSWMQYPGVNGNTRVAADEYIAHFAESVEYNQTIWDKIVKFIKELFASKDVTINISDDGLTELLRASYDKLVSEASARMEPEKISLNDYLGRLGLSSPISDYMDDKLRNPHGLSKSQRNQLEKEAKDVADDYHTRRNAAVDEYNRMVAQGKIIPPTQIDRLIATANGHPDNEATQAARRSLEKRGYDWQTGQKKPVEVQSEAKKASKTIKAERAKDEKIEDFGEKIGGARKDVARVKIRDSIKLTTKDLVELKDPDKILSRKNIIKYYSEGVMTFEDAVKLLAMNMAVRGRDTIDRGVAMKKYRNLAMAWEGGSELIVEITDEDVQDRMNEYSERMRQTPDFEKKTRKNLEMFVLKVYKDYKATYEALNYPEVYRNLKSAYIRYGEQDGRYWVVGGPNAYRGYPFPTLEQAIAKMVKLYPEQTVAKEPSESKKDGEKSSSIHVTKDRAGYYRIKSRNIPGEIYLSGKLYSKKDAEAYLAENLDKLVERENRLLEALLGSNIGMVEREGLDYRKGKDVTPKDFLDTFGVRGVEFGNWVPQVERQAYLNKTYDAIMDFCRIVGISPKAFSLGGRLGLAFGSRGKSRALAHYEPMKEVINLTRMKGAGSLAHEWFHALDNYLAKQRSGNTSDMTTDNKPAVRQEVTDAFNAFVSAMNRLAYTRRSNRAGQYWGEVWERAARLFESYIYNELGGQNIVSPLLVKKDTLYVDHGEFSDDAWPYPSAEENEQMKPYFDRLFSTLQEQVEEDGSVTLFRAKDAGRKQAQFDIINETNPMTDDYHVGIRKVEDIKTFDEVMETARRESEEGGWPELASYPDIENSLLEDALETRRIVIYSSHPISNGTFVTPSYMQADEYSGMTGEVYSKEVSVDDIAWINTDEGQYASLNDATDRYNDTPDEDVRFRTEQTKDRVENLFTAAVNGTFKGKPVSIGTLTKEGKQYLESISGLTFKDKVDFMLNASDLVHMYNEHFGENEKDPGNNIPLTIDDIRNIVDVVLNPEKVLYLGEDEGKRFAFLAPADSGAYNLIEVYTTKRGNLSSKTFYKTKKGVSHRAMILEKESRHSTSETNGATLSDAKIPILFDIANQGNGNTLFRTRITPEQDAAYLKAVEAGDMETAQRMVNEAARLAMPNTKVVDESGNPRIVYHGTLAKNLTRFDKDFIGSRYSYDEKGFFFISRESIAKDYATSDFGKGQGTIIPAFINLQNPLVVNQKWATNNGLGGRVFKDNDVIEFWDNYQTLMIEESENNDGVVISDGTDLMVVAFEPSQIKSADPVTYDNAGNVIPLSKRFNEEKSDIRFRTTEIIPEVRKEMDVISATAIVNGNYMKAPNGKDSNLTPEQWAMVRTESFKLWFGDWENDPANASKVVDENGEPMVVYHGTQSKFTAFDVGYKGTNFGFRLSDGFYFSPDETVAESYASFPDELKTGEVKAVFLNILNPFHIKSAKDYREQIKEIVSLAARGNRYQADLVAGMSESELLSQRGYDGVVEKRTDGITGEIVVFDPNQIKSATDNTGVFSVYDDIRFRTRYDVNTNPTEAQKKAGNYKMGHIRLDGYNITIENPKGSVRRGTDSKGNAWENTLNNDYGYIRGTEGVDGDHIDVYLSDNPTEGNVFVIEQVNPETREFDEHKVMYGFSSAEEAREAYLANFSEGWNGLGTITEVSKDEFKKWIESSHRKTKPFSEYKPVRTNEMQATDESDLRYRVVTNRETLDRLNSEPTIKVYRAMQVIDGKLYPPMSAKVDGKLREPIELGQWEEAEERPDLADEKGNFKFDKGNKTSVPARYNPYFHTSRTPLNDQFSSAQTRPNLVTVEVEVPESELTSGYKAEKAKDSVGEKEWKAGIIQGKLSGTRKVILSRWDKPVRIVPDSEVAERIIEMFDGRDITMPSNVVTPSLRTELEKLGVPFIETNNQGKPIESTQFRTTGTPTEQVVKDGIVLSNEDFTNLAGNIFSAMPEDVRRKVVENAARDNYDLKKATLQISASLAEKAELTDEEIELAKMVAQKVEDVVLASGVEMTRPFTTNEALWVLYQSIYPTSEYDLIGNARKAVVADNLGISKSQQEEQEMDADNIRFRSARGVAANSAAAMYNNEQRSAWGMLRETYQDMYRSVKSLMQSIEKATGKVAQSWENILTSLNALSSKNLADKKKYLRDFLTPMWDAALAIRDKYHKSLEQIERYLMIKHGLERNKVLAARDARNFYREQADQEIAAIKADKSLSKAEQKARIQRVEDTYDNHVLDIEAGIDAKFQEFRAKDYGGLTALFSDFADYGTREDYESEELYQEAALAARTPKYATLAETELAAQQEVEAFEKEVDKALIDNLWKKINAATKETLRHQYANNMLTKEQYERVRDMFEFYVPLRGFVDTTAEETYSYYVSGQQSKFANPLQGAKGRKTQAETPLGWIGSMAESAIQMDNKNTAKLALYYFAVNRPDNDILKITPTWYEWTGEVDSDGKKIFEPVYPTFNGPQSGPAMQAQMDAFESMMEQQAQAGNAYKGKQRIDLKEAVIRAPKSTPEHIVTVKVAGEDYSIIINANPRAAQAINGMLNVETRKDWFHRATTGLLRYLAAINTSYSPLFWITNFMRDISFAFINTSIRNDAGYTKEFAKNYPKAFRVFLYVHKNRKAALGDSKYEKYYTEFAENGGITGYTSLTNNTEYDQIMKAYANDARLGKFIKGIKSAFQVFQNVGESFEQVSRFAAYITARESGKDISESIYEAKEVTINFNRKGSGRALTMEEAEKFRRKNGKKLTAPERIFFVTLAGMSPFAREFYMFFNAGMQGVRMIAKLVKEHPGKFAAWHGIVFTMGLINAIIHALAEDDDEYLDMPDYVRRTNILIGKNGTYFKWSLPHEFRPSYAMADILVQHAMGRKPNENIVAELAETFGEWLPINPFKDGMNAFVPDFVKIVAEIKDNKDFTGSPIFREYRWLTEEQQKNMPAYEKGFDSTSKVLVDISEMLNDLSGGDQTKAGFININPAVVEHLAQKFGGGPLKLAEQFFKTIGVMAGDQEFSIRNTPFLSTFMVVADDRYRNAHTTELFKYYKGMADDVKRRAGEYKAEKDKEGFDKLRVSDDFQIFQIYRKYEKRDKFYNEQLKRAKSDSERKEIMSLQDAHRKRMIEEISNL